MTPPDVILPDAIRKPAVAGQFYPDSPLQLQREVDALLDRVTTVLPTGEVVALVAPHAGYAYSGETAASAFRQITGHHFDTVFVLCPSHRDYFSGVSVYTGGGYETPLGIVPIDRERGLRLIACAPDLIHETTLGHRAEHAIEVELPFLQRILTPSWKLAPLVMADRSAEVCARLAAAIIAVSEGIATLIVASSDLYHGYSYEACHTTDEKTLGAIKRFDADLFIQGLEEERYQACGGGPIAVAMLVARRNGVDTVEILGHTTSGDVTGRHDGYTVGYGAVAFRKAAVSTQSTVTTAAMTESERNQLLDIAIKALEEVALRPYEPSIIPEPAPGGRLADPGGAFVTIRHHGALRGCIGQIQATTPLYQTVQYVARAAATQDPRFSPVTPEELDELTVSISLLSPLTPLHDTKDLRIGDHGLYIRQGESSGLLLPQVARDRGWDRETFLAQTCLKAGLAPDAWRDPETEILYFTADLIGE